MVAHAPPPSDTGRIADLRRLAIGAVEGGASRVLIAADHAGLANRATVGLPNLIEVLPAETEGTADDTARAAAALREHQVGVIIVSGGDGTHRDVARGWRNAPIVAVGGGTNNAFPQVIEATVAGTAAGLVVTGDVPLDELIAYQALVIDIRIDGEARDIALVDVGVQRGPVTGSKFVWDVDGIDQILAAVAEPWSIGLSSLAGLVAPTSRTDDRGVLLDLDPDAPQRVRAPLAPGHFVEAGVRSVSIVEPGQPVAVRGPAEFVVDGERGDRLADHEWGSMTLRRDGPRVVDIRRTFSLAVRRGHFYSDSSGSR